MIMQFLKCTIWITKHKHPPPLKALLTKNPSYRTQSKSPVHPASSYQLLSTNRCGSKPALLKIYQHIISTYFQAGMVWMVKVQLQRSLGSTCSGNTTCKSPTSCWRLQCTKPVQLVGTQLFILVQLLQFLMQWLMSHNESYLHKRLTVKAHNKFRLQSKQILHSWRPESFGSNICGLQVWKIPHCVSWSLGFPLQLCKREAKEGKG